MKHALIIIALIAGIFTASMFVSSQDEPDVKVITPTPSSMTEELRNCLISLPPAGRLSDIYGPIPEPTIVDGGRELWYEIENKYLGMVGTVKVIWAVNADNQPLPDCQYPPEWLGALFGYPTPYLLPDEVRNGGTPVS